MGNLYSFEWIFELELMKEATVVYMQVWKEFFIVSASKLLPQYMELGVSKQAVVPGYGPYPQHL
jgi:hypothetical protein